MLSAVVADDDPQIRAGIKKIVRWVSLYITDSKICPIILCPKNT